MVFMDNAPKMFSKQLTNTPSQVPNFFGAFTPVATFLADSAAYWSSWEPTVYNESPNKYL